MAQQPITNTEFISLTYLSFDDKLDLLANNIQSYQSSSKIPTFEAFMKDLLTKAPKNFDYRSLKSMVIINEQFARLTSRPRAKGKEMLNEAKPRPSKIIYECSIPYSEMNIVLLDALILQIKNGGGIG